jgi:hypothetical protein
MLAVHVTSPDNGNHCVTFFVLVERTTIGMLGRFDFNSQQEMPNFWSLTTDRSFLESNRLLTVLIQPFSSHLALEALHITRLCTSVQDAIETHPIPKLLMPRATLGHPRKLPGVTQLRAGAVCDRFTQDSLLGRLRATGARPRRITDPRAITAGHVLLWMGHSKRHACLTKDYIV